MSIAECNASVPSNMNRIINDRGLKQSAVARWAGYSKQQFTAMLNGRRLIKPCDVMAIASALDVEVGELFVESQSTA